MKRIYISGGVTDVPDYMKKFDAAENELIDKGYRSIINPAFVCKGLPEDFRHDEYMAVCITMLSMADAIYMLKGYEKSKGATIELEFAKKHKFEVIYQE